MLNWGGTAVFSFFILFLIFENVSGQNVTREEKQVGGLFSVVSFPNLACRTDNNLNGTCMTRSECTAVNGEVQGSCARGFGGCCFIRIQACGGDVRYNQTYVQNPDYPSATMAISATEDRECVYRFYPPSSDTCNVRLDFAEFVMGPPDPKSSTWKCERGETDYVTVEHADGNMRSGIHLCGHNTGHHVYLDMGTPSSSPGYAELKLFLDSTNYQTFSRTWNILASFIDCNTPYTPPRGCQRFFFGNLGTGIVEAYNYNQPIKAYAARLNGFHTVCIRREKGMCQISYVPPDVDTDDEGFAVNGDPASLFKGRVACKHPSPVACASYIRITQGSATGITPYGFPPGGRCDRHCGRRLCDTHQGCTSSDHDVIISRVIPFRLEIELRPHSPTSYENRGYKLNYAQSAC